MVSKELLLIMFLGCLAVASVSAYPFCSDTLSPTFCNNIETGSMMNLNMGSVNTQLGNSYIMDSADFGLGIFNNVQVTSYGDYYPSVGSVSAFIRGTVKEGGRSTIESYRWDTLEFDPSTGEFTETTSYGFFEEKAEDLAMTMTFSDYTSFTGSITDFRKSMSYSSSSFA